MKQSVLTALVAVLVIGFAATVMAATTRYKCQRCGKIVTYSQDKGYSIKCPNNDKGNMYRF